MKAFKLLAAGLIAATFVSAASAQTVIHITGSTAFRKATHTAIGDSLKSGYTVGYVGTDLGKASQAIFKGTTLSGSHSVIIKTNWTGSVGGIATLTKNLTVGPGGSAYGGGGWLVNGTPAGPNAPANFDPPTTADVTLSDSFQASAPPTFRSPVLSGKIVGVVPFEWVKGNGGSSLITNLTSSQAQSLLAGTLKLSSFGGSATVNVVAVGRDEDSGTRIGALADSGYGVSKFVKQYQPLPVSTVVTTPVTAVQLWPAVTVDGIAYPQGDSGYSSGGALALQLSRPDNISNVKFIGYLGINDAATVTGAGSGVLKFNNQTYTVANTETNAYGFWGYEHFLFRSNYNTTSPIGYSTAISIEQTLLTKDAAVSGILISGMRVHRNSDGGTILSGGTPPNVP